MIVLLSPAKSLNYAPVAEQAPHLASLAHTLPHFVQQPPKLVAAARKLSAKKLSELMDISDDLAKLNVARFKFWQPEYTTENAKQAVLAFDGDVYTGLQAATLTADDLNWAQTHLGMLSGLYGVLRPLDLMQPYRLEMGSALVTKTGKTEHKNLYGFWGTQITEHLNERLAESNSDIFVNLASQEYFKSVKTDALKARVIECVFEDEKNGKFKVISFFAKQARGLMARYIILNRITTPAKLKKFNLAGYAYAADASTEDRLVFQRKSPAN
ncbi:MAG: peroxide stress protein YaaA [Burkholderiaceae bacterium]